LAIPVDGYLARIRALCDQFGALLIFDETRTGLRLGPGGAGALFGVVPDLVCLGGSLSAGLPLAVVGGRKDLLTIGAPGVNGCVEESYGTEIGVAAALAALQATADPAFYEQLDEHAATLERGLAESASAASVQLYLSRSCSLIGMYFTSGEVLNWDAAREVNTTRYGRFHGFMLDSGVLVPSSPHRPWAVSSAHTAEQIQVTVEAARDALARSA
jgi:glutamate-1-semialdehyde 2,1-aminomutase